jgi:hypothetical protein
MTDREQKLKAARAFMAIAQKPLPEPKPEPSLTEWAATMFGDQYPWLKDLDKGEKK